MPEKFEKYIELDTGEDYRIFVSYTNMTQAQAEKVFSAVESELSRIFSLLQKTGYLQFATGEFEKDFVFSRVIVKYAVKLTKYFVHLERTV